MNIGHMVIVLPTCGGRTIGQHAVTRAQYFARKYRVTIISDVFPEEFPDAVARITVSPLTFNFLFRFCHVPNDLAFALAARKKLKQLDSFQPVSFVLCHSYSLTHYVGRYMKQKYSVRYGMFMHGDIFTRPTGTYDRRITSYYRWLAPGCYRDADLIFSLSKEQMRLAIKAGSVKGKVKLAPNGIELDKLGITHEMISNSDVLRFSKNTIKLLYVGRCTPEKGFHILIDACEQLLDLGHDFHLQVVGGGGMSESDLKRITDGALTKNITLTTTVPRHQLGKYYLGSDFLCVPSIDEPFGNVVLEGMIAGCVVIGSDTGGIPDIIESGQTGYLFPPGNSNELTARIVECAADKHTCARMAAAAKSHSQSQFSWENILKRMEKDIEDATNMVGSS